MKNEKKIIAIFDFDGTLTTKDTLFDFISFSKGKVKLYTGLVFLTPMLLLYKLSLISNNKAKEILFSYYFRNNDYCEFKSYCQQYIERIESILQKDSWQQLNIYKNNNDKILIISASIYEWIEPWASKNDIQVVATNIEVEDNKITGKFSSKNCYGIEKVNRLKKEYPDRQNYYIVAFGDSNGDKELLDYADESKLYKR